MFEFTQVSLQRFCADALHARRCAKILTAIVAGLAVVLLILDVVGVGISGSNSAAEATSGSIKLISEITIAALIVACLSGMAYYCSRLAGDIPYMDNHPADHLVLRLTSYAYLASLIANGVAGWSIQFPEAYVLFVGLAGTGFGCLLTVSLSRILSARALQFGGSEAYRLSSFYRIAGYAMVAIAVVITYTWLERGGSLRYHGIYAVTWVILCLNLSRIEVLAKNFQEQLESFQREAIN